MHALGMPWTVHRRDRTRPASAPTARPPGCPRRAGSRAGVSGRIDLLSLGIVGRCPRVAHRSGRDYRCLDPTSPIAEAPAWVVRWLAAAPPAVAPTPRASSRPNLPARRPGPLAVPAWVRRVTPMGRTRGTRVARRRSMRSRRHLVAAGYDDAIIAEHAARPAATASQRLRPANSRPGGTRRGRRAADGSDTKWRGPGRSRTWSVHVACRNGNANAAELLAHLRTAGGRGGRTDPTGRVRIQPRARLTPELHDTVTACLPGLVDLLQAETHVGTTRRRRGTGRAGRRRRPTCSRRRFRRTTSSRSTWRTRVPRTDAALEFHEVGALVLLANATPRVRAHLAPYPSGLPTEPLHAPARGFHAEPEEHRARARARSPGAGAPAEPPPRPVSPEAFVEQLAERPGASHTWFADEFTSVLDRLHHTKYMAGLQGLLLTVYGGASYRYAGTPSASGRPASVRSTRISSPIRTCRFSARRPRRSSSA